MLARASLSSEESRYPRAEGYGDPRSGEGCGDHRSLLSNVSSLSRHSSRASSASPPLGGGGEGGGQRETTGYEPFVTQLVGGAHQQHHQLQQPPQDQQHSRTLLLPSPPSQLAETAVRLGTSSPGTQYHFCSSSRSVCHAKRLVY